MRACVQSSARASARGVLWILLLALTMVGGGSRLRAVQAQGTVYQYLPSSRVDNGRMFGLAGHMLSTMGGTRISVSVDVPPDRSTFEIGVFDGDTGRNAGGAVTGAGHWDQGTDELVYTLYADPMQDQSGTVAVAQWTGNTANPLSGTLWTASAATMPDNGWWRRWAPLETAYGGTLTATACRTPANRDWPACA